jgi:hypothetical protein
MPANPFQLPPERGEVAIHEVIAAGHEREVAIPTPMPAKGHVHVGMAGQHASSVSLTDRPRTPSPTKVSARGGPCQSSRPWQRAQAGCRSEAGTERAKPRMGAASVRRDGTGHPEPRATYSHTCSRPSSMSGIFFARTRRTRSSV